MDGGRSSALLALVVAVSVSSQALACIIIDPDNRALFKDAIHVYEGVATSPLFSFDVFRTWRGTPISEVDLPGAWKKSLEWCSGQVAVKEGKTYLLVIFCRQPDDPEVPEVFSCPARVEAIESAEAAQRLRFLEEGWVVTRREIADHLEAFLTGGLSPSGLAAWLRRANELGDVDDWITDPEDPEDEVSVTDGVLRALDSMLENSDVPDAPLADACLLRAMYHSVAPRLIPALRAEPPLESDSDRLLAFAEELWDLEDICYD